MSLLPHFLRKVNLPSQSPKYYIEDGKTGKMDLLPVDEIKNKLQAGDVTLDSPCLSQKGTWENVKNLLTASELRQLVLPEAKEECDQIWEADQQWPELQQLRANFEGKVAIYVEKGVFLVRVSKIHCPGFRLSVQANIEEIALPGLGFATDDGPPLCHWRIGCQVDSDMRFSNYEWNHSSQGGYWQIYSHPEVIKDVLALMKQRPDKMNSVVMRCFPGREISGGCYRQILKLLCQREIEAART